jgi:hypothetical protein
MQLQSFLGYAPKVFKGIVALYHQITSIIVALPRQAVMLGRTKMSNYFPSFAPSIKMILGVSCSYSHTSQVAQSVYIF